MIFFRYRGYSEDIEALRGQPVQYEATGRMIKPWAKEETVPVPKRKPVRPPIPRRKPETIISNRKRE